ncbi:MAG: M28 family peptidase [Planctomycetes bacterium]|nr:M28 family peptidase [Planctomycetota bacterium]
MRNPVAWLCPCLVAAFAPAAPAQVDTITEARVREAVGWLADDARGGRDTPSPGLDEAASWLARRFAAAGLQRAVPDSWRHEYTLPGLRLDSRGIVVKLTRKTGDRLREFALRPETDVRLWRAADVPSGADEPCTVAQLADPALQRLLRAESARRPVVLEVAADHPFWLAASGPRTAPGARRAASRPVFLVRAGLLPPPLADGSETPWTITWQAPQAEPADLPAANVVALLPGSSREQEHVVVSAHYDHLGTGLPVDGDAVYNGADDDASGTAGVLLLAEAMGKESPPRRSVLFVCFSGEAKGLRGSRAFVAAPPVPLDRIVANLNLEMLGRPAPGQQGKAWITGAELSDLAAIAAPPLQRAGIGLVDFPMARHLFAGSDNWSFVRAGIVAHSISAGSLHADYHRPGDETDKLDFQHLTQVLRGLHGVVRELADREAAPAWNESGRQLLERLHR